ncbi:hypothetical protein JKF63_02070 [Porcisia hertigi]|uniref:Uncharacterized protein n=1 Tax=Porcisia hertigi TaxID=2761500 RepID=A0A836I7J1_9TRYP|nr:hypothetical protein JKF63_02070 [Porcisia hertigi]
MPPHLGDEPSLSVATLPRKAVVLGFGSRFIVGRYPLDDDATPSPHNSVVVDDGQIVRAVAFLQIPNGPLCVVSAGDGKLINVYNVSSWRENNPNAIQNSSDDDNVKGGMDTAGFVDDEVHSKSTVSVQSASAKRKQLAEADYWKPSYQYGPHTKRITSLATCSEGTILFADKFGEVYRIRLSWSPSHTIEVDGDATTPAKFLLQHFSIISTLYLTAPVPRIEPVAASEERSAVACRRLFTCDRENHVRVSRFPESYVIEQFLWTRGTVQSAVTCVSEIPYVEVAVVSGSSHPHSTVPVNEHNQAPNAPYSYYVTGTHGGDVHFWAAKNDVPIQSDTETFSLISTFHPCAAGGQPENFGPVLGVTVLRGDMDSFGYPRHSSDYPCGVLVAYEGCTDVFFVPIYSHTVTHTIRPAVASATRTSLDARPAAMVGSDDATAFVLKRNGRVSFIRLRDTASSVTGASTEASISDTNVQAQVQQLPFQMPYLEERIRAVMCGPAAVGKGEAAGTEANVLSELEALDLCALWRYEAVNPQKRRHNNDEGDSDKESADDEDGQTGSLPKEGTSKKMVRVEAPGAH